MRNLFTILSAILFSYTVFSQKTMTFQADIANRNGDVIYIKENKNVIQEIKIDKDNHFKATFEIKEGMYTMYDGVEYTELFLKNGYDLKLTMDAKQFDESIKYTGKGAAENNFLAKATVEESAFNYDEMLSADETTFTQLAEDKKNADLKKLASATLDANFVAIQKQNIEQSLLGLKQYHDKILANKKLNNTVAPNFNYENHDGGKTTLESLKGKYVYIDVWATWCGPCRAEIPSLKLVEEKYHAKNIQFVSISVDVAKDHDKWVKFVTDKQLGGIQLIADKDWTSDFIKAFSINSIPRFILIDPSGKVVDADAARPSDPRLQEQLNGLLP